MGHTHCGAVDAAINHAPEGYIRFITEEIRAAIGDETDPYKASCLNVRRSIELIESSIVIQLDEEEEGLRVIGAMYDIETGEVTFMDE
jgi:carbonic anhydrase